MPPKKKEKAKDTCDVGTDPPEPLAYDPFDVDGYGLLKDFKSIPEYTQDALDELKTQNTSGAPLSIRDNVIKKLETTLKWMKWFEESLEKTRTVTHRFQSIEREIREIKADTKEIKESVTKDPPAKTWAQLATNHCQPPNPKTASSDKRRERIRKQHEPYEVALVTLNDQTKKSIANMPGSVITQHCQDLVNMETDTKPKINGISKTANGIRLTCETPEDAKIIRTLNWKNAKLDGLQLHKRNYGVVIHRVSTDVLAELENEDTKATTLNAWAEAN
jgi:hypothetical protein